MNKLKLLAVCCLLTNVFVVNAQTHQLKLKSGVINTVAQSSILIPATQQYNGWNFFIIQFEKVLTYNQQQELKNNGLVLMNYLPQYAYYAACKSNFNPNLLVAAGVRCVIDLNSSFKMSIEMQSGVYPDYCQKSHDQLELSVKLHQLVNVDDAVKLLIENNAEILNSESFTSTVRILLPKNKLAAVAALAVVQYIEPTGIVGQPENYLERGTHRTRAIAVDYGAGRKYNGAGVTVGIGDDGIIGPHADYTGRIDQTQVSGNNGDHGDHCSGILMGAGNIDPKERGQAWGSFLYVYNYPDNLDFANNGYDNFNIRVTSSSYSDGCNAGYTAFAQQCDMQIRSRPEMLHSFSAGNQGGVDCGYGAGGSFGNITGGQKQAKNVINAAALTNGDVVTSYSSRGPAADGRTEPKVSAVGDNVNSTVSPNIYQLNSGTSMSCPAVSGTLAQLYSAYKQLNGGATPPSALIKAVMMNTCDELGNVGPDFTYGYGRINALRAAKVLEQATYFNDSLTTGNSTTFTINVPSNSQQLRVMLYWHDVEGALNAVPALVNDLDLSVDFNGNNYLPYVLNSSPNVGSLSSPALPGVDHLNNEEQVVIDLPVAGSYTVNVSGFAVPQGVQDFFVTYEIVTEAITVTYPIGGESMVPGETEYIRWDAYGNTSTFTISYSIDNGANWNIISAAAAPNFRSYAWLVPNNLTGEALIKIERNGITGISDNVFNIMTVPSNLQIDFACPDSIGMSWNTANGALFYEASVLGNQFMDSAGTSIATNFVYTNIDASVEHWFSVKAHGPNGAVGRRAIAIYKAGGVVNCLIALDAGLTTLSPGTSTFYQCAFNGTLPVSVDIKNEGINPISNFDIAYTLNNGTPVVETFTGTIAQGATANFTFATTINAASPGIYAIATYTQLAGDGNSYNDTLNSIVTVINATPVSLPYNEDFETFNTCNTSSDCEATVCPLGNGLINETNLDKDDIDWRCNAGATPSAGTGPDVDHTTGNATGKYAYTEASNGCFFKSALLITPCIDLVAATNPTLNFYYHMYGVNMGELHIDILSNGVWITDVVAPVTGDQGNSWILKTVGLSNYVGQVINIRFRGITGADYASDLAIDDIGVTEISGLNQHYSQASNISIQPNPSNGLFDLLIQNAEKGNLSIEISDTKGAILFSKNFNNNLQVAKFGFDLSDFAKGIYVVKVINGLKVSNERLMVY